MNGLVCGDLCVNGRWEFVRDATLLDYKTANGLAYGKLRIGGDMHEEMKNGVLVQVYRNERTIVVELARMDSYKPLLNRTKEWLNGWLLCKEAERMRIEEVKDDE